jgi:hypothetical protein
VGSGSGVVVVTVVTVVVVSISGGWWSPEVVAGLRCDRYVERVAGWYNRNYY